MSRFGPGTRAVTVVAALLIAALVLAACSEDFGASGQDGGPITTQASGKFSSGSVFSGSVNGQFEVVGIGNTTNVPHEVKFEVDGAVWFTCVNNGGNEAPGQFDFTADDVDILDPSVDEPDRNGRYGTEVLTVDPKDLTDEDCTRNKTWTLKRYEEPNPYGEVPGSVITWVSPDVITAYLIEVEDGVRTESDRLQWNCDLPDPTYPLEDYVLPGGLEDYCTLVVGSL